MRDATIGRNYAETLMELARRAGGDLRGWGAMLQEVASGMERDGKLRRFLDSPRVNATQKSAIIGKAFGATLPRSMVRFLQALVMHRRQMLIPQIALEYHTLVDEVEGRVHAHVTVARETSAADQAMIAKQLGRVMGKEIVPHVTVNPEILGGVIVKVGDRVIDGSVRRRLQILRTKLVGAR